MSGESIKKKSSWYSGCVPSCGSRKDALADGTQTGQSSGDIPAGGGLQTMTCRNCNLAQAVSRTSPAFVCVSCHRVNRIVVKDFGNTRRMSVALDVGEAQIFSLVRTSSTTFAPEEGQDRSLFKKNEVVVPLCNVCMDGPGDMVLLPCTHGSICEACAQHISRNLSVGGSHCPKCRVDIKQLIRISELYPQEAKGIAVIVPDDEKQKGPPKVPPPPGQNKSKSTRQA